MLSYGQGILTPSTLILFSERQGLYVLSKSCTRFMLHSQSSTNGCWLVPEYTTWSRRSYQGQFWDVNLPSSAHRLLRRHGRGKKEIVDCVRSSFASQITLLGGLGLNPSQVQILPCHFGQIECAIHKDTSWLHSKAEDV